ncbi:MAG TPA: DUF5691 domain-containing protein [Streptosporangiaceae bacterium]|jgi:hypothetical protein|nr:DUF5691 domain-containing protein [Streptosporangiaceae bacterium]
MTGWAEHVTAALLGTQRRQPPAFPDAVADGDDPAARLLAQAALLTVRRRAGRRPERAEPLAPAAAETAPVVPPAAARRIERILAGEQVRVLPEWLAAAAAAGWRVPAATLPDLLERGRTDRALRPYIAAAAGRRAMWLALRNPDWAYLVGEPPEPSPGPGDPAVWEMGSRGRRMTYLERLRDVDPDAARAALRGTWTSEPAPDRAAFLATFERGLGPADEDFLEEARADRAKDVRQVAADLLARLPGSAYARQVAARAAACLRTERRPGRQTWIIVEPPDGGIAALCDLLAHTPPGNWTTRFRRSAAEVVHLPIADDHDKDVHIGWARAAVSCRDVEWARALLGVLAAEIDVAVDLLGVLPAAERAARAADLLRGADGYRGLIRVLDRMPGPWAGELADAVLDALADAAARPDGARYLGQLCRLADERLSPGVADRLVEITRRHDTWPLAELAETLRFRRDMLEELSER